MEKKKGRHGAHLEGLGAEGSNGEEGDDGADGATARGRSDEEEGDPVLPKVLQAARTTAVGPDVDDQRSRLANLGRRRSVMANRTEEAAELRRSLGGGARATEATAWAAYIANNRGDVAAPGPSAVPHALDVPAGGRKEFHRGEKEK